MQYPKSKNFSADDLYIKMAKGKKISVSTNLDQGCYEVVKKNERVGSLTPDEYYKLQDRTGIISALLLFPGCVVGTHLVHESSPDRIYEVECRYINRKLRKKLHPKSR